jgi:hypothetical protein
MPDGKLTALEARKRLLIAESEINRELLRQDYRVLAEHVHEITQPVRTTSNWLAKAASVLAFVRQVGIGHSQNGSSSRFRWPMRLLRLGTALWVGFRGNGH